MPMPSSSSATIANCACCAAGSVGSSATSAARSPDGPSSRRYSKRRSRALRRSDRNSSASVDGSSIPSTPPRSNASSMKGCGSPGCRRAEVRSGSFATEIACPRRVRFYPDGGLNDETRARLVAACWRFAARSEAIHLATVRKNGLLRCARNDGLSAMAQHATLSVVIARQQVRATRGPMTGSGVIRRLEDGPSIT